MRALTPAQVRWVAIRKDGGSAVAHVVERNARHAKFGCVRMCVDSIAFASYCSADGAPAFAGSAHPRANSATARNASCRCTLFVARLIDDLVDGRNNCGRMIQENLMGRTRDDEMRTH